MGKGRPGGNPDIIEYSFQAAGDEPLNEHLQLKVTPSTKAFVRSLGDEGPAFVREAIDKAIAQRQAQDKAPQ